MRTIGVRGRAASFRAGPVHALQLAPDESFEAGTARNKQAKAACRCRDWFTSLRGQASAAGCDPPSKNSISSIPNWNSASIKGWTKKGAPVPYRHLAAALDAAFSAISVERRAILPPPLGPGSHEALEATRSRLSKETADCAQQRHE